LTKDIYNKYVGAGFQLIELGEDKKPLKKRIKENGKCNKSSEPFAADKFYAIVPSNKLLIIDVDVKNGKRGLESLSKLEADLMIDLIPSVRTGSGGLHIYATIKEPIRIIQKEYPDIDFITHRANNRLCTPYAVAGGQTITYKGENYVYELLHEDGIYINKVEGLEDILEIGQIVVDPDEDIISVEDLYEKKTPDEVTKLLSWLDASDYHEWMANASAIKRELGNTKEAFEIFDKWSQTADNYDNRDACLKKWKEVGEYNGQPRTMATLYMKAVANKTNNLITKINQCKDHEDLGKLISDNEWTRYPKFPSKIIQNEITKSFQAQVQRLGIPANYSECQTITKRLYGKELSDTKIICEMVEDDADEDFLDFVRVASFTRCPYFQISNGARHDLEGINMILSKPLSVISQKLGLKKTMTVQQAFQNKLIRYAVNHEYNPTTNDRLFIDEDGKQVLNLFNPETVPEATDITNEGQKLIYKFMNHLSVLMSEDEAETFLDWMAYATQNPGKKILWVPLIQSIEGVGKSLIGNLLINHVFGKANAGVVDSVIIADKNNSWSSSKMLRILEEIKLSGHNRYEVLNQLKPLITNGTVTRVEKFEVSSEVRNTCNFIAFTNFKDALPIDEHDRRWWLVFSPINSLNELEKVVGQSRQDYFYPLHELARADSPYGSEFKTFLLRRNIENFNPNFPPESKHKEELAEIERSKLMGIDEVQDLITFVYKDDQPKVINMTLIREASEQAINDNGKRITPRGVNPKEIRSVLKRLGYKSISKVEFGDADWKGISPMYYHTPTTTIPEAVLIWKKGHTVDFLSAQFDDLDEL
jgi:hypothetical protein